jgi:hypothetical protein
MSLFQRSSVATITSSLSRMVTELEEHCNQMCQQALRHRVLASAAENEAQQAERVREKLQGILE